MTTLRRRGVALVLLGLAAAGAALAPLAAVQPATNPSDLVRELQKQSMSADRIAVAFWMPEELWLATMTAGTGATPEQREAFLAIVRPYLLVAAVEGKIGPLGGTDFVDKETIRAKVAVVDKNGVVYRPLADAQLSGDVRNLSSIVRSLFGNMLGAMGQGTHLFFFPARGADGSQIAAPTADGSFSVKVGTETFKWRLPLGSVLPPNVCPEDGEVLSGAWKFCPWHGKPLSRKDKGGAAGLRP